MQHTDRLSADERAFLSLVNRAVFANPFGDERVRIDLELAGLQGPVPDDRRISRVIGRIAGWMEDFEEKGRARVGRFGGRDREMVENGILYHFFNRFIDVFDRLILDQIAAGDAPLPVPFARDAFAYLTRRGFPDAAAKRYFELAFQLRRAYYFIDRSLVGRSPCMRALRHQLWNNVFTRDLDLYNRFLWNRMEDFATLILGGTGTGKGTAAAAIGRSGFIPFDAQKGRFVESFTRTFVSLNLSQFPENLIESELFGHRKGAFTGAVDDYEGVLDRCSPHGAIFLDEIGEVSAHVQIKLLQVLQERVFSPVGGHGGHRFAGRVIAATNRSLSRLRGPGGMRDDFFYRLCSDVVTVPTLHQRIREDAGELEDLLSHTVHRILGRSSPDLCRMVARTVHEQLGADYPWPGNVRELEQYVRRVLLNRGTPGDAGSPDNPPPGLLEALESGTLSARELLSGYCRHLYRRNGTYEAVARVTGLDRRTVKKYVLIEN